MPFWRAKRSRGSGSRFFDPNAPGGGSSDLLPDADSQAASSHHESQALRSLVDNFLANSSRLQVLDLGRISQGTAKCVSELGHRITFVDLLRCFDTARSERASESRSFTPVSANLIIRQELDFPLKSFDTILAWGVLQHLDTESMRLAISHLSKIIRPGGVLHCMFHSAPSDQLIPLYDCAIEPPGAISLLEVERRRQFQSFSPRAFEVHFTEFREIHFFLKKGALFEALVFT